MSLHLQGTFGWAIALAVGFVLASVILAEVVLRLRRRGNALAAPAGFIRDFILPVLAILVLLTQVVGWDFSDPWVRVVETIFWLFVVNAALSFLNAILFARAREGTWQAKMPRLFIDLARAVIVLVCLAIVLSTVWGQNLGHLVAALGVGSLVLGLALQQPVGNLFSGIILMMERPVNVGDWIRYNNNLGMVVESNWRSMHLRTRDNDLIVVPNGLLATGSFINYSRPNTQHAENVTLYFSCDDAPNKVKPILIETALRTTHVLANPAPKVRLSEFTQSAIRYDVKLTVTNFAALTDILEEFRTLVWYAARREGLTMPYPHQIHHVITEPADGGEPAGLSWDDLAAFPHLRLTGSDALRNVTRKSVRDYAKGEVLVKEGQRLPGLHLILRGKVALSARNVEGKEVEFDRLERGEFFGEKSLLSAAPSDATVTVLEDLEVLVLEGESIDALIDQSPQFSRQVSGVAEARRRALNLTRGNGNGTAHT